MVARGEVVHQHLEVPSTFRNSVRPEEFSAERVVADGQAVIVVQGEVDVLTAPLLWERLALAMELETKSSLKQQFGRLCTF